MLCPDTNLEQAHTLAEALWQSLLREEMPGVGVVTASFGCASWREGETADALLRRVDSAVYAAKQGGRNQVRDADDPPPFPEALRKGRGTQRLDWP